MTDAQGLTAVKLRLKLKDSTTYDTELADFLAAGVRRLYPKTGLEVDPTTQAVSADQYGEVEISLPAGVNYARRVEYSDGSVWVTLTDKYHHGSKLRLREVPEDATQLRIYGIKRFATLDDVPEELTQAVIWFAMSEFYDHETGDKSDYNIYMQTSGARAVDNMQDASAYYEAKANMYLEEQHQVY